MTIALVLGLASLATAAPSQASSPRSRSLAELVHRSERVVVGEIVRVHRIRVRASPDYCPGPAVQDVDVAEIDVERTVWGADDARHVFVVIPIGRREPLTGGPARSLWFLARSKPLQPADRDSRERSAGWAPVVRLADDDDGRVPLADATLGELSGWIQRIIESDAPYITAELETFGPPVHAVHGNMDDAALRSRLPGALVVDVGGLRIGMTHDAGPRTGREERLVRRFPSCAAVVYGHTHEPQVAREGEVWILNPGSPTERRRAPTHTMLVLEVAEGSITPELIRLS